MTKDNRTSMEEYFFYNSLERESLMNHRLFYDLKKAAAQRHYFLNIYHPEIDKEGFDVILDDGDSILKVQLKTVMKRTTTSSWDIHKALLRPNMYICEDLGFEPSPSGTGYQGGIILMEVEDNNGLKVDYYYTDIILICGIHAGIIDLVNPPDKTKLDSFLKKLKKGGSHEKIVVPISIFLKVKSTHSLLALTDLHNNETTGIWRFHLQRMIVSHKYSKLPAPPETLKEEINREIAFISESVKQITT